MMDGIHDLGGRQGFGAVCPEADEPAFHERWEARVFTSMAAVTAAGVIRNVDQFRHAIERIDPVAYLTHGYYGRWLGGIETLLLESGRLEPDALSARVEALGGDASLAAAARPAPRPDRIDYRSEGHSRRPLRAAPQFACGQTVRTRAVGTSGHTRLPAYARGRVGLITARHDGWVFPDSNAHGHGEAPQHLYTVAFEGAELWGADAERGLVVHLDLFESYLEAL